MNHLVLTVLHSIMVPQGDGRGHPVPRSLGDPTATLALHWWSSRSAVAFAAVSTVKATRGAVSGETTPTVTTFLPRRPDALARWLPAAVSAFLIVALALRMYELQNAPDFLADEVLAAVDLQSVVSNGVHYNGAPLGLLGRIVPILDLRLAMSWLGTSVPHLRVIAMLIGMASIGLAYRIGTQISGRRMGCAAAVALAFMPWHIYYSRLYLPQSQYLFLTLATISLLIGALVHRSLGQGLLAVAAAVTSIYVYPASILSTPLVILTVLVAYRRELGRYGFWRATGLAAGGAACMLPYVLDHLFAGASAAADQNDVISQKLMWTHGLPFPQVVGRMITNWLSFFNPSFLVARGDPNIRQSSQRVGQIGLVFLVLGIVGIVVALRRRSRGDLLWLTWLALYPFSSAITYFDAAGNSARAVFGCLPWAMAVGSGLLFLFEQLAPFRLWVVAWAAVVVTAQTAVFLPDYLTNYPERASPAFEVGWSAVQPVLAARSLDQVPITLHAGYDRATIAQYFAGGRLAIAQSVFSCAPLQADVVAVTSLPRVFVIRNDYDFSRDPGCFQGDLVAADLDVLRAARLPGGRAPDVEVLGSFPAGRTRPVVVVLVSTPGTVPLPRP